MLRRVLGGGVAGVLATGVMSLVMLTAKQVGALGEPPPKRITRRLLSRAGLAPHRGLALDAAALAAHFAFGASMGGAYALLPARARSLSGGTLFGLGVWGANYAGWLPKAGLMPRPLFDRPGRPTVMLLAHLAFGATLASVVRCVSTRLPASSVAE